MGPKRNRAGKAPSGDREREQIRLLWALLEWVVQQLGFTGGANNLARHLLLARDSAAEASAAVNTAAVLAAVARAPCQYAMMGAAGPPAPAAPAAPATPAALLPAAPLHVHQQHQQLQLKQKPLTLDKQQPLALDQLLPEHPQHPHQSGGHLQEECHLP